MFVLLSSGYHYSHPSGIKIERPGGAGNYAFVFFKTPSFTLLGGKTLSVPPNSYTLFAPSTPQLYFHDKPPFINDWFHCEGAGLKEFLDGLDFPVDKIIPSRDPQMISNSIREFSGLLRYSGEYAREIIDSELKSFFYKLKSEYNLTEMSDTQRRYYQAFARLRNDIYNSPGERRTVGEMSAELRLSRSYFQHIYKKMFGVSVISDIVYSRVEFAKYYLSTGLYSVSEVAGVCGYENTAHFIRQFKKLTGVTPGKYCSLF